MPEDKFRDEPRGLDSPATRHVLIVPSDSADLPVRPRVVYCQAAGSAVIRDELGADLTYALAQGQILPFSAVRVLATGTTATLYGWV